MAEEFNIWQNVPDPQQQKVYIIDEPKENEFTVLVELEVGGYDTLEMLYMINGVWRVNVEDQDDDEETPSALLNITVDRRFSVQEVHAAVTKLIENLYTSEV